MSVTFAGVIPILRVADVDASLTYYERKLGFTMQWRVSDFLCVERGDTSLFLTEGDQGHPGTWLWIAVSDADALHDELRASGAFIRHPPTNYPWGSRELHVTDPDGHVLRLASDATDEPVGEWLDTKGRRWMPQPDGSWIEVT